MKQVRLVRGALALQVAIFLSRLQFTSDCCFRVTVTAPPERLNRSSRRC